MASGYFPKELPPPFVTENYATNAAALALSWQPNAIRKFITAPEIYSIPRYGHARRKLSIVNPVNQLHVAHLISENWPAIKTRLDRSKITEFKPNIQFALAGRAISGVDFDAVSRRQAAILASYGRYVKTDIARFYPSVYTHSIPWALMGKDWVKDNYNQPTFKGQWFDNLDAAIRACQTGQTIGIPIGPDTSRILSELIVTEIEETLRNTIPDLSHRAVRYVDDMIIGLRDDEDAPKVLSHLSSALYNFELDLNAEKTTLHGVGFIHSPEWQSFVRGFDVSSKTSKQREEIDSFFEQVCYLADVNLRDSVISFAARRATTFKIDPANQAHLSRWLMYCVRRAPSSLHSVVQYLAQNHSGPGAISKDEVATFVREQIVTNAKFAHTDEVAWYLYWALRVGMTLPATILRNLLPLRSSVVALLTLHLNFRSLINGTLDTSFWQSFASVSGLRSEMWLVAYEATKKGWWQSAQSPTFITGHSFFSDIFQKQVSFYDESKIGTPSQTVGTLPDWLTKTLEQAAIPY